MAGGPLTSKQRQNQQQKKACLPSFLNVAYMGLKDLWLQPSGCSKHRQVWMSPMVLLIPFYSLFIAPKSKRVSDSLCQSYS